MPSLRAKDNSFYPAHPIDVIVVFIAAYCQRFEYCHIELIPTNKLIHHLPTIRENKLCSCLHEVSHTGVLPHIIAEIAPALSAHRYQWAAPPLRSWKSVNGRCLHPTTHLMRVFIGVLNMTTSQQNHPGTHSTTFAIAATLSHLLVVEIMLL